MPHRDGGARAIKETRETLPDGQIWSFALKIDAQSCLLPHGATRVAISLLDCRQ